MDSLERVDVSLGDRSYGIEIGEGVASRVGPWLSEQGRRRCAIIADPVVDRLFGDQVHRSLLEAGLTLAGRFTLPADGEAAKTLENAGQLLDRLLAEGIDRRTVLVALGGGVTGDLAGMVAALALRGIDFVQIPTTLLAQVDSSVGGKTGVNSRHGKNLIGAFHQPCLVLADLEMLDSLPHRELLAGYAEVVKYGALGDAEFFQWLEENGKAVLNGDPALRAKAVAHSCRMKAEIVAEDEREGGKRALLNLGHTFGHALESALGYDGRLLHGEGVAIGMVLAFDLSVRLGDCSAEDRDRLISHLQAVGLPTRIDADGLPALSAADLLRRMGSDKKVQDQLIVFVTVDGMGRAKVNKRVPVDRVLETLQASGAGA